MVLRLVAVPRECYSGDAGGGSGNASCYLPQSSRFLNERHIYTLYFYMPETAQWLGHFLTSIWLMHAPHIPKLLFTKICISTPFLPVPDPDMQPSWAASPSFYIAALLSGLLLLVEVS